MTNLIQAAKDSVNEILQAAYRRAAERGELPVGAELLGTVEIPKDTANGDFAANHAMAGARALHMAPRKIAEALIANAELDGTWFESLEAAGIKPGDLADDPLKAIEHVGDPMMPANIGIIAGAAKSVPVIVGGGTQMAAVMAGVVKMHPEVVGNFFQGTTRWLMNDPNSSMKRIMDGISDRIPIVYVNVDYSDSPYEGLQAYEWGFIKEGVGCGGASVGAIIESSGKVTCKDLVDKVHELYRGIMGFD